MKHIIKFILILLILLCLIGAVYIAKVIWEEKQVNENILPNNIKQRAFIETLAENLLRPLLVARIDFYLKESQALQHLYQEAFLDKMIIKTDIIAGKGEITRCGQKVVVRILDELKDITLSTEDLSNIEYQIGLIDNPLLDIGLLGMKKGGTRILEVSASHLKDKAKIPFNKIIKKIIQLVDIKDTYSSNVEGLLAFSEGSSGAQAAMCGDTIDISYKIKTLTGTLLNSGNKQYKIGARQMPLAFELGMIGAQPLIKRFIIATGDLMTDIPNKSPLLNNQLGKDEGIIIEVDLH